VSFTRDTIKTHGTANSFGGAHGVSVCRTKNRLVAMGRSRYALISVQTALSSAKKIKVQE